MKSRVLSILMLLIFCGSASAVIQLKLTVAMTYSRCSPVLIGKATALNAEKRVIDVDVVETLTGQSAPKLKIQLVQPQALFSRVKVGDPIVLFAAKGKGAGDATIHLADTWLIGRSKAGSDSLIWKIEQEQSNDMTKAYPGTTETLIKLVHEYKEGKASFLDKADERLFADGATEIAQLKITPNGLFTADLNGDKIPELIISTPHGPRIFAASGQNYEDATAKYGLPDSGKVSAVGDINGDGKADLLIDNTPYINQGSSFKAGAPIDVPKDTFVAMDGKLVILTSSGKLSFGETRTFQKVRALPLAAVIGPFDEDNKTAGVILTESTITRYSLDGHASDFTRLTGEPLSTYLKDSGGKFKNPKLVSLDANGDGRRDLLVLSEGANFLLINRGFGAYFVSPAAAHLALGTADKAFPYAASATSSHWAAIDTRGDHHDDLLILTPDGTLYRLGNPPPK